MSAPARALQEAVFATLSGRRDARDAARRRQRLRRRAAQRSRRPMCISAS